jgi:hypothetical protein
MEYTLIALAGIVIGVFLRHFEVRTLKFMVKQHEAVQQQLLDRLFYKNNLPNQITDQVRAAKKNPDSLPARYQEGLPDLFKEREHYER